MMSLGDDGGFVKLDLVHVNSAVQKNPRQQAAHSITLSLRTGGSDQSI